MLELSNCVGDQSNTVQLQRGLKAILPSGVRACVREVQACINEYPEELRHLANAAEHRRNEFLTGRVCARTALSRLDVSRMALHPDKDGVPIWPPSTLGSISHSRGLCAAVAAKTNAYECLGLDIEKIDRLSHLAMKRVVNDEESVWVDQNQARGSLLFSAKEAFFKAQFPRWRCQGNFHDITLHVNPASSTLEIVFISSNFPKDLRRRAGEFELRYHAFGDYVATVCWLKGD